MDNAVPKVILKMMNVDGMTRENVASHLQKYRLHLKHQTDNQKDRPETDMFMHALESPASRKISSRPRAEPSQAARGLPLSLTAPTPHAVPPVTGIGLPLCCSLSLGTHAQSRPPLLAFLFSCTQPPEPCEWLVMWQLGSCSHACCGLLMMGCYLTRPL